MCAFMVIEGYRIFCLWYIDGIQFWAHSHRHRVNFNKFKNSLGNNIIVVAKEVKCQRMLC